MNLYNIINSLKLNILDENLLNRNELYSHIKIISNYINCDTSKLNKQELKKIFAGIKFYLETKSDKTKFQNIWNFKSGSIILDNEQNQIIISDPNQHQRIIAGAGSGKTTTILCRVKYLVDNFMTPDRILILTFNRDSAQNIRNRIDDLFGFPVNLHIYTIDAFCCKLMYMYGTNKYSNNIKSLSEYSIIGLEIMKLYGQEISNQFKHIFFDEFQDVNDTQFHILKIFTNWNSWLTVIGDDCQNIYQFRGTNNYYMINFDTIISNSHTYKLTSNYRSTKLIVDMANDSISWNYNRVNKNMKWTNSNESIKPILTICSNDSDKYEYIIKKIKKFIKLGYSYGDIAILSRNTYPLKCMETELTKHLIPHVALITDKNSDDNTKLLDPNKLALTTVFKSKGLEFAIVILLGLSHEHWPEHMNNNIKNIEEERRLFYVGITRCKKYLYMISSVIEVPLSIFIKEILSHILIKFYKIKNKISRKKLFDSSDSESTLKLTYGVNELINSLQSHDYLNLRNLNLILELEPIINTVFETKLQWSEDISLGAFEADFGEYVDRYITRGICVGLQLDFIDVDTEYIINQNLDNLIPNLSYSNALDNDKKTNLLIKKIQEQQIIRKFTFPQNVINKIKISYQQVQNILISNDKLEEQIYWISLCRNFRLDRTRLAYRNIYNNFKSNMTNTFSKINLSDTIKSRMEWYIRKFGFIDKNLFTNFPKCKINLEHVFKNKLNKKCFILGELDILVPTNIIDPNFKSDNYYTLIDIKCSDNDFKLEWEIQLLTYYSLFKLNNIYPNFIINRMGIINIMDGKEYYFTIPSDYNCAKLIEYLEEKINIDQQSLRPKPELNMIINYDSNQSNNNSDIINIKNLSCNDSTNDPIFFQRYNLKNINYNNLVMVLDTETTDFNGDIIQLAYVLADIDNSYNSSKIIKKFNKIVINRISTVNSEKIHKINISRIRKDGVDFYSIMKEFIEDLSKVNVVIGHNIHFDIRIIINNLRKFNIEIINSSDEYIYNIFQNYIIECTKKLSGGKSLEELYLKLFGTKIIGAHDALSDVIATLECYIQLNSNLDSHNNYIEKIYY